MGDVLDSPHIFCHEAVSNTPRVLPPCAKQEATELGQRGRINTRTMSKYTCYAFFAAFGFDAGIGALTTFEEYSPVCGGFGFPRILMTCLQI